MWGGISYIRLEYAEELCPFREKVRIVLLKWRVVMLSAIHLNLKLSRATVNSGRIPASQQTASLESI